MSAAWLPGRRRRLLLRLFEIAERLLEQRGGRPGLLWLGSGHVRDGYVRHVFLFFRSRFTRRRLFLVVLDRVRVARVSLHVRELPLVTVRIDVTVLAPDHAVCAARLLLETAVVRLVTERERTVVVQLVVVPDGLRGRFLLLLLLRLFLRPLLLRRPAGRLLSDDHLLLLRFIVVGLFALPWQQPGRLSYHNHGLPFGVHFDRRQPLLLQQRSPGDQHLLRPLFVVIERLLR